MAHRKATQSELETHLDAERAILMSGDFTRIERFIEMKANNFDQIRARSKILSKTDLHRLSFKIKRNQALLSSLAEGLRSALQRISELRKISSGEGTYHVDGKRDMKQSSNSRLSKLS